jgi:hypothetical protein
MVFSSALLVVAFDVAKMGNNCSLKRSSFKGSGQLTVNC